MPFLVLSLFLACQTSLLKADTLLKITAILDNVASSVDLYLTMRSAVDMYKTFNLNNIIVYFKSMTLVLQRLESLRCFLFIFARQSLANIGCNLLHYDLNDSIMASIRCRLIFNNIIVYFKCKMY